MKKSLSIIIVVVVIALLFGTLVFYANLNKKNKENKITENGVTTYATILYCGFKNDGGNFVSIEYVVNGKKYLDRTSAPSNQYQVNEQIEIVYNNDDPTKFLAHFYNIKLNDTIQYKSIEATIINIDPTEKKVNNINISMLTYEYFVNNIKYTRTNEVLETDNIKYTVGQKLAISYNIYNPKSSIIVQ